MGLMGMVAKHVSYTPDGKYLAVGSFDTLLTLYDK
jgi:hypothetical protein